MTAALLDHLERIRQVVAILVITAVAIAALTSAVDHLRWKRRTSRKRRGGLIT